MIPHGYWTQARIKELSKNNKRSSEVEKKNNYLSKQNAESIDTTNVKQTEEKENKIVRFLNEPVHIITNNEEMNSVEFLDANYEKANLQEFVNACSNLDETQKEKLFDLLMKYEDLFQGIRGNWKGDEVTIIIKPFFKKPYLVPLINQEGSKRVIHQQFELGAMR